MTDRTLDEAMGMTPAEITQLRAKVDRIARPRCDDCHRPLPHTQPEQRACPSSHLARPDSDDTARPGTHTVGSLPWPVANHRSAGEVAIP